MLPPVMVKGSERLIIPFSVTFELFCNREKKL